MIKTKPDLKFNQLWNISFGFFGVQIAFALQSANISRIFATLGADPHKLSYFWILPPLLGMIVQPLVGIFSDRTWNRFGRRIPYLFLGATFAVAVMCLLPNAGNLGLTKETVLLGLSGAMLFGLFALMFLDASINMAMQPFKMMVGDMVNEKQKAKAYSIQSFLCNAGQLVGFLFPFVLTLIGVSNDAPDGVIPDSVKWSFYGGAAILILCVLYTTTHVKEYAPEQMAAFREATKQQENNVATHTESTGKHAVKVFATVALVQFFCWAAFQCMWVYNNGAIAHLGFGVDILDPKHASTPAYQEAGNWVGNLLAVQAAISIIWAAVLAKAKNIKLAYSLSLLVGAIGFLLVPHCTDITLFNSITIPAKYVLMVPYGLTGLTWAAMLAMPFTLVTNALEGNRRMGTYLGLFNCTICLPQLVISGLGGNILKALGDNQVNMIFLAGILLALGTIAVFIIPAKKKVIRN